MATRAAFRLPSSTLRLCLAGQGGAAAAAAIKSKSTQSLFFKQQQRSAAYIKFEPPVPVPGGGRYNRFHGSQRKRQNIFERWQSNPGFRKLIGATAVGGGVFYVYNLELVPVSGRRRFNVIGTDMEVQLAKQMYQKTLEQFKGKILPPNHRTTRYVARVMNRLVPVSGLEDLNWEVFVIKDDSIKNAFVIPGGKVFVFTGILEICHDEDGLAAVMSHEIAHTVAHHASERMSQSLLAIFGLILASIVIGGDPGPLANMLLDLMYLKPGSRKQEAEADYIGLMIMAQACYNPRMAMGLWERMEKTQQFEPPQFISTHPSHRTRIQKIQEWMPEALRKRAESDCQGGIEDYAFQFRKAFEYANW